jgi:type I restriction enzyme R subunit
VTANDGAIGDTFLDQFKDNENSIPTILTTSQKLSTGVDAQNIRNIVLLRIVTSMIEFKQIIGRGTRQYDGKTYFTILDFYNNYRHFNDTEWDGEPLEPEPTSAQQGTRELEASNNRDKPGSSDEEPAKEIRLRIRLSDGKVRELQSMRSTFFYVDGKPISSEEFLQRLFSTLNLPEFFGTEQKLRELWASPITRRELLKRLDEHGCGKDDLVKLQQMIEADNSDLFDVLEYISYAKKPISRRERVEQAHGNIYNFLNAPQRDFVNFVLRNYVQDGVDELDIGKLSTTINSKYGSINEATRHLGTTDEIRRLFVDFQQKLYVA